MRAIAGHSHRPGKRCTEAPHKDRMSAPCGHVTKGMTKREEFLKTNKQESKGCFRPDVYILPPKNNFV